MLSRIKRILKHRWLDESATRRTIPPDMLQRLQRRVAASEQRHSGEIRIYVEAGLPLSYLWRDASTRQIIRQRALALFGKLRVWDTASNNGVLIYLLLAEHAIELVADRGLNDIVEPQVWQAMVSRMSSAFQRGQFEDGLTHALEEVSALLVHHFPLKAGEVNPNELPDSPVLN
ncbi:TPM domain-containing protein [Rhodoferax sp.]|uniref:TPM domain-containing protein n=1 Tax=Rhodoferax sp. TaxID=50421 RepID=UPI00271A97A6|nr:TPM domain-containing protein [Rhodoferax sp.]MDO9197773.1 TPM domain-containing protein [Rhodoferax sp.]